MLPGDTENGSVANETQKNAVRKTQCSGCGKYFVGLTAFDDHHKGIPAKRRCMTNKELQAAGFAWEVRAVMMYRDGKPIRENHNVWYSATDREAVRQAFGRGDAEVEEEEEEQLLNIDIVV